MSDTLETDAALRACFRPEWVDYDPLIEASMRLERQRDAYAETLREILAMDPDWTVIAKRHPELANKPALPPTVGSGES